MSDLSKQAAGWMLLVITLAGSSAHAGPTLDKACRQKRIDFEMALERCSETRNRPRRTGIGVTPSRLFADPSALGDSAPTNDRNTEGALQPAIESLLPRSVRVRIRPARVKAGDLVSLVIEYRNRSKQSVALRFEAPEGREEVRVMDRSGHPLEEEESVAGLVGRWPGDQKIIALNLPPGGVLRQEIIWSAHKRLQPGQAYIDQDPLPKGRYKLEVETPFYRYEKSKVKPPYPEGYTPAPSRVKTRVVAAGHVRVY